MDSDKTVYYAPYHGAEKEEYSIEYSGRIVGYKLEIGYRIYDWLSIFMNYNHEDNVIGSHPENINMGTARYYQSSKENYNLATRFEKNISNYNIYAKPSLSLKTNLSFFERVLKNDRVRRYEDKIFTGRYYGLLIGISNIIGQRSEVKSKLGYKLEGFYKGYYYNSKSYSRRIGISVGLLYNIDL